MERVEAVVGRALVVDDPDDHPVADGVDIEEPAMNFAVSVVRGPAHCLFSALSPRRRNSADCPGASRSSSRLIFLYCSRSMLMKIVSSGVSLAKNAPAAR